MTNRVVAAVALLLASTRGAAQTIVFEEEREPHPGVAAPPEYAGCRAGPSASALPVTLALVLLLGWSRRRASRGKAA